MKSKACEARQSLYDMKWKNNSNCNSCEAGDAEMSRSYHCKEWADVTNKMPDEVRMCEMKMKPSA